MTKQLFKILIAVITLSSCSLPKETQSLLIKTPKDTLNFPSDYCLSFPSLNINDWNNHYNFYDKFKTKEINKTQFGLTFYNNGVKTYFCYPSANPYVQLDTSTMINDITLILGEWRSVCNKKVIFEDSISYIDKNIYRNTKEIDKDFETDYFLSLNEAKIRIYSLEKNKSKFKRISSKNYSIVNKRYLMAYNLSKAGAAINFIGLDKDGRLILESFYQQERSSDEKYIVFHATMTQQIFERFK